MFCKISVFITLVAASAQLVAANTPACLLAAINTQSNPSDIKAVCNKASDVEQTISSTCGGNAQAAMAAFKSVCQNAGVSVSAYASATGTASATGGAHAGTSTILYTSHFYDSSCSCTKATLVTGTAYVGPSGIATGTSGSNGTVPAQATGAASGSAGSTAGATGASGSASATGTAAPTSTGAAGRVELTGLSMGALAIAGLAMVL